MRTIATAAWLLASMLPCLARADLRYEGEARDTDSGALLYEEHHYLRRDGDAVRERIVLYRCPDGRPFARKRLHYDDAPAAPTFELDDARFGYREGTRREGEALIAFVRTEAGGPERSAAVAPSARLVIDAGFDEFVRANWVALQGGETLTLDFLVPSRLETLGFKLRRVGAASLQGESASVFRLSLGGLIGFFAPDIEVSYRDRDRRLMRFEGLTNIRADREENLAARIDFPLARERAALAAEAWDAAAREPLSDCSPGG